MRLRLISARLSTALFLVCIAASIAFSAKPDDAWSVFVMRRDGSGVHRVVAIEAFSELAGPRWSHDGRRLVFEAGGNRPTRALIVDVTGRNLLDLGSGKSPDWSPDDKQVVYAMPGVDGSSVWVQNADGKAGTRLCAGMAPRWSPDGGQIAVCGPLRLLDTFAGTLRAMFEAEAGVTRTVGCAWSPDAARLAAVVERDGKLELVVIDPAATPPAFEVRWQAEFDGPPSWSPDGKQLAVAIRDPVSGLRRICLLETAGDDPPRPVAGQEGDNRDPSWSPDGKHLAFVGTRDP